MKQIELSRAGYSNCKREVVEEGQWGEGKQWGCDKRAKCTTLLSDGQIKKNWQTTTQTKRLNSYWGKARADRQMLITVLRPQRLYIRRTQPQPLGNCAQGSEFLADRKRHQVWIRRNSKWICSHALLKASLIAFAYDFWDAWCERTNPSIRQETIISERFPH